MKINKSRSKSPLFLMELIIVLLFFSLSAAICMKVFSSAKVRTDRSRNLANAGFAAESIAECFKSAKLEGKSLSELYPQAEVRDGVFNVYFGSDWTETSFSEMVYRATVIETNEPYIARAKITVFDSKDNVIFELRCAASPGKGAD